MTISEIYSNIYSHMIKGMMIHEQLADYYDFLGLEGYKRCHEYHFLLETCAFRGLCRYYINHHNKLIPEQKIDNPDVIPQSWYKYTRQDVDTNTKRNAVKEALNAWVNWEKETKQLYEKSYNELIALNEVASACKIKELIKDVDCELKKAERYLLNKKAIDFDINDIIAEQKSKHKKYKHKMEKLGVKIC